MINIYTEIIHVTYKLTGNKPSKTASHVTDNSTVTRTKLYYNIPISGTTPWFSNPQKLSPVRPNPVCT